MRQHALTTSFQDQQASQERSVPQTTSYHIRPPHLGGRFNHATSEQKDSVSKSYKLYACRHMQVIGNSRTLFANAAENEDPPESSPAPAVLQDRSNLQPPANGKAPASKAPPHLEEPQGGQVPGRRKLRFASLDLPSMDALSGCDAKGAVHSYEDAVKQFNKAMTAFKGALEVTPKSLLQSFASVRAVLPGCRFACLRGALDAEQD